MRSFLLKPLYNRALDGLPLLGTPAETAGRFLSGPGTLAERAEEMVGTYKLLCGSTGFLFGLPGFLSMPVTLPANIAAVATLQLHLCAATAFMGGHDPFDDDVRDRCIRCLIGREPDEKGDERAEAEEVFDRSAVKLAERGLRFLAESTVGLATRATKWTAEKVIKRQVTRRSLPIVGGVIGGASDAYVTGRVAEAARDAFIDEDDTPRLVAEIASGDGAPASDPS